MGRISRVKSTIPALPPAADNSGPPVSPRTPDRTIKAMGASFITSDIQHQAHCAGYGSKSSRCGPKHTQKTSQGWELHDAVELIGRLGTNAKPVVPRLLSLLTDSNPMFVKRSRIHCSGLIPKRLRERRSAAGE